mmetsp:Transcript_22082/g.71081  ORF Transcript_22082/g.71081 Transcript_22082/m.71081 type:complete len:255 (-) Transcript_22082:960-1724(-)
MPAKKAKGGATAKSKEKAKKKVVEDRTFGLKNKGKSKKVQQYVTQVEKSLLGAGPERSKKAEKKAKREEELAMAALFKEAKKKNAGQQQQRREEDEVQEVKEEDLPLEERIERQRARLPPGGTKVTEEVFIAWLKRRARRRKRERDRLRKDGKAPESDAKSSMTGKELFTKNSDLFVDDADAADVDGLATGGDGEEEEVKEGEGAAAEGADATEAGAAADADGAEAATGIVEEDNAALFLDDVDLEELDDEGGD